MHMSATKKKPVQKKNSCSVGLRRRGLWLGGGVLLAVLSVLLVCGYPALLSVGWALLLAAVAALRLTMGELSARRLSRLCFAAAPLLSFTLVELLNHNQPWTGFSALQIALNLGFYYLGAALLYGIAGRRNLATQLGLGLAYCLGMANHYVIAFRGRTIFPADLLTLRTALNVAGNYDYIPDRTQIAAGLITLLAILAIALLPRAAGRAKLSFKLAVPTAVGGAAFLTLLFATDFFAAAGIEPSMWTTRENGLVLNFSVCLRYQKIPAPEGYSVQTAGEIGAPYADAAVSAAAGLTGATQPVNVITIMNESFSDLGVLPGVEANQDWMPFWRSLSENTVRGTAYASVFGGTTANSEYEFLTGNTTAFLPAGTVPFQMYVAPEDPSLAGQMKALGYRNIAMHPYLSSGWNRVPVYRDYGFDEVYFESDFKDPAYLRGYVSDRSNYENLIARYEAKTPGEPLFFFNVTMQNHGAYNVPWTQLEKTTWLTGQYAGAFDTVDQYLSLIHESDRAFAFLIDYFSKVEEPTLILMFGDHQPQVATNFYTEVLGGETADLDVETAQKKQKVPFLLWANYDIPERDGLELSLNYLSSLLLETANLPKTGYQAFLDDLRAVLPVVNAVGIQDSAGNWYKSADALPQDARAQLAPYQSLLYNNIFDAKNRLADFFTLPQNPQISRKPWRAAAPLR